MAELVNGKDPEMTEVSLAVRSRLSDFIEVRNALRRLRKVSKPVEDFITMLDSVIEAPVGQAACGGISRAGEAIATTPQPEAIAALMHALDTQGGRDLPPNVAAVSEFHDLGHHIISALGLDDSWHKRLDERPDFPGFDAPNLDEVVEQDMNHTDEVVRAALDQPSDMNAKLKALGRMGQAMERLQAIKRGVDDGTTIHHSQPAPERRSVNDLLADFDFGNTTDEPN